jgi:hypothetical protein
MIDQWIAKLYSSLQCAVCCCTSSDQVMFLSYTLPTLHTGGQKLAVVKLGPECNGLSSTKQVDE